LNNSEIQKLKKSKNLMIQDLEIGGAVVIDGKISVLADLVKSGNKGSFMDKNGQAIVSGNGEDLVKGLEYYISPSEVGKLSNIKVSSLVGKDLSFGIMMDSRGYVFIPKEVKYFPPYTPPVGSSITPRPLG